MKVGPSFLDSIHTEKITRRRNNFDFSHARFNFLLIFLFAAVIILFLRLFFMQIINGNYYKNLSDSNRIRSTTIHAPRGVIFDRNGKPLVVNTPGFRQVSSGKTTLLDNAEALNLLAKGESLEIDSLRNYPCGVSCAHVIGYVGQITPQELIDNASLFYKSTDLIGKEGIENSYESLLRGVDGHKLTEVDAAGKEIRVLGQTDPTPGQNITLTIDEDLQKVIATSMKTVKKGAVVATNPNGEVLALFSSPTFDPNLFTMGKNYKIDPSSPYQNVSSILLDGTYQPLLDRAISGTYPPGSTFKIVAASAALTDKIIDDKFTITDTGILKVGDFSFANWFFTQYGRTEGEVNVVKAIQRSNDIFFYKIGQMLGVDRLSAFAANFGVGKILGIDLKGEASGLLPTTEWKEKVIHDKWYLGDDYHYGIGQGYLLTTPLQVNAWTQAIANGGQLFQPHILKSTKPSVISQNPLSIATQDLIRQGMIEACSTGGVAWPLFNFKVKNPDLRNKVDGKDFYIPEDVSSQSADMVGVRIACKTGTAEHGDTSKTTPHAWITLFAPAYHPQIILTILSEDSGEGSNVAGPIAKEILEKYFEKL